MRDRPLCARICLRVPALRELPSEHHLFDRIPSATSRAIGRNARRVRVVREHPYLSGS